MRIAILSILLLSMASCKTVKPVVSDAVNHPNDTVATVEPKVSFIRNYYGGLSDFRTLNIKASAKYEDDKQEQSVTADIRIKKDEMILVSIRFLGITMAKALITPQSVKYYEKIDGTFFEGDYTTLSKWLGTELDFQKVQNLLLGRPLENIADKNLEPKQDGSAFVIEDNSKRAIPKVYTFLESKLKRSEIKQPSAGRNLTVDYPSYKETLPAQVLIDALHEKGKTNIRINYNASTFNEELSFPYSVPQGYERVFIE